MTLKAGVVWCAVDRHPERSTSFRIIVWEAARVTPGALATLQPSSTLTQTVHSRIDSCWAIPLSTFVPCPLYRVLCYESLMGAQLSQRDMLDVGADTVSHACLQFEFTENTVGNTALIQLTHGLEIRRVICVQVSGELPTWLSRPHHYRCAGPPITGSGSSPTGGRATSAGESSMAIGPAALRRGRSVRGTYASSAITGTQHSTHRERPQGATTAIRS